jgi:adenine phosphoribosyltransferase
MALKLPFIPVRKAGKLPGEVVGIDYGLEYGKNRQEMQKNALKKGDKVIVADDLLATGGTASSACKLITDMGAEIVECCFIIELKDLHGRQKAPKVCVII